MCECSRIGCTCTYLRKYICVCLRVFYYIHGASNYMILNSCPFHYSQVPQSLLERAESSNFRKVILQSRSTRPRPSWDRIGNFWTTNAWAYRISQKKAMNSEKNFLCAT